MKLACASGALHRTIESGELTQLEFLDLCARELACDGVVLDVRHFPRTDDDYLAQVKKMAADWGLCIAALYDAQLLRLQRDRAGEILRHAAALGAPLVGAPLGGERDFPWSEQLERLSDATADAKRYNVTLALRNLPQTYAASTHDCKRAIKEADSAWLRYGPQPAALDSASDPLALAGNSVLLWSAAASASREAPQIAGTFANFRGFVALDEPGGEASAQSLRAALAVWRDALCEKRTPDRR